MSRSSTIAALAVGTCLEASRLGRPGFGLFVDLLDFVLDDALFSSFKAAPPVHDIETIRHCGKISGTATVVPGRRSGDSVSEERRIFPFLIEFTR